MQRPRAIYHINPDFRGIYRIYFMFEKVSTRIHQLQDFEPPFAEIFGQVVIIYSRYLSELNSSVRAISDPLNHLQSRNSYIGTLKITLNTNKNLHSFPPLWVSWLSLASNQHCKVGEGGGGRKILNNPCSWPSI